MEGLGGGGRPGRAGLGGEFSGVWAARRLPQLFSLLIWGLALRLLGFLGVTECGGLSCPLVQPCLEPWGRFLPLQAGLRKEKEK